MKARLAKIYNQHVIMSFFILLPLVEAITSITKVSDKTFYFPRCKSNELEFVKYLDENSIIEGQFNIKEPKGVWIVFASLLSVAAIVGAILMACLTKEQMWYNYIFYPFALVGLVYIIYLVIYFTPKVKPWITTKMSKYHFLDSMLHDYGYRAIFFAICSMAINVAFVVVMGFIAIKNRSFWFGTFAVYYILLTIMRALAVLTNKKSDRQKDLKTYLLTAIFLLLINIALTVMIFLILNKAAGARYEGLMVYISAVYIILKALIKKKQN